MICSIVVSAVEKVKVLWEGKDVLGFRMGGCTYK